jgi:hypothetical protein
MNDIANKASLNVDFRSQFWSYTKLILKHYTGAWASVSNHEGMSSQQADLPGVDHHTSLYHQFNSLQEVYNKEAYSRMFFQSHLKFEQKRHFETIRQYQILYQECWRLQEGVKQKNNALVAQQEKISELETIINIYQAGYLHPGTELHVEEPENRDPLIPSTPVLEPQTTPTQSGKGEDCAENDLKEPEYFDLTVED